MYLTAIARRTLLALAVLTLAGSAASTQAHAFKPGGMPISDDCGLWCPPDPPIAVDR